MTMSVKPMFSVVIALFNQRANIQRTLNSVLSQTCQNFELLIVCGGSATDTEEPIEKERFELVGANGKIRWIGQVQGGVSTAWNKGIEAAKGSVVAFLAAGDTWEAHFLDEVYCLVNQFSEADAYATGYQYIVGENRYIDPKIRFSKPLNEPRILHDYFDVGAKGALPFTVSSFCIHREFLNRIGGFPEGEGMGDEQDLFIRAALHSQVAYNPSVLSFRHTEAESRAPERTIPMSEYGFSHRLKEYAKNEINDAARKSLLNYAASHLLHIASLNVRIARYDVANRILDDPCCKTQPHRYFWWRLRIYLALAMGRNLGNQRSARA